MKFLEDGFSTIVSLEHQLDIELYGYDVTPPGITSGGPINTTTMRNTAWRTQVHKKLKSMTPMTMTMAVVTKSIPKVQNQIGVNQLITVAFPDGLKIAFYGWIDELTFGAFREGERALATLNIIPSLVNAQGIETPPTYRGLWILAYGDWNDSGEWIDTAFWQD